MLRRRIMMQSGVMLIPPDNEIWSSAEIDYISNLTYAGFESSYRDHKLKLTRYVFSNPLIYTTKDYLRDVSISTDIYFPRSFVNLSTAWCFYNTMGYYHFWGEITNIGHAVLGGGGNRHMFFYQKNKVPTIHSSAFVFFGYGRFVFHLSKTLEQEWNALIQSHAGLSDYKNKYPQNIIFDLE